MNDSRKAATMRPVAIVAVDDGGQNLLITVGTVTVQLDLATAEDLVTALDEALGLLEQGRSAVRAVPLSDEDTRPLPMADESRPLDRSN